MTCGYKTETEESNMRNRSSAIAAIPQTLRFDMGFVSQYRAQLLFCWRRHFYRHDARLPVHFTVFRRRNRGLFTLCESESYRDNNSDSNNDLKNSMRFRSTNKAPQAYD